LIKKVLQSDNQFVIVDHVVSENELIVYTKQKYLTIYIDAFDDITLTRLLQCENNPSFNYLLYGSEHNMSYLKDLCHLSFENNTLNDLKHIISQIQAKLI